MSNSIPVRRPFKIMNEDQSIKKGVTAHSLADLIERGIEKLCLKAGSSVNLSLDDGTEIDDEDYFQTINENSTLILKISTVDTQNRKKQERANLRSTTSRYKENVEHLPPSPHTSHVQQPYYKPSPGPVPLMPAATNPRQEPFMLNQQALNIQAYKGVFTLTFTTENLIDLRRIEAEFRFYGPVTAESDYKRVNGRARVFVSFSEAQHALNALQQLFNCFYDLEVSKHCIVESKAKPNNRFFSGFGKDPRENDLELYVGNLPPNIGYSKLKNVFKNYDVQFRDYKDKKSYCFAQMYNMDDMMSAIKDLNGYKMQDKKIVVRLKKETQNMIQEIPKKKPSIMIQEIPKKKPSIMIQEIPKKKPSIIDEVKKKAQIKEERLLKERLMKKEKEEAEKNASKVKKYLQTEDKEEPIDSTQCFLCNETCKRGVKLSCCGVRACRARAVLEVTKTSKCWRPGCEKAITTADIVNDHEMREKISKLMEDKAETEVACA